MFAWRRNRKRPTTTHGTIKPEQAVPLPSGLQSTEVTITSDDPVAPMKEEINTIQQQPLHSKRRHSLPVTITKDPQNDDSCNRTIVWVTDDVDIGVTNVLMAKSSNQHSNNDKNHRNDTTSILVYEIALRFPHIERLWRVQRSYSDFVRFHGVMEKLFHAELQDRHIQLPRPARLSWESFRSLSSGGATLADTPAAQRMMLKLNGYLHKLLEIEAIYTSDDFRDFFSPRPHSADTEIHGKLLPTISIGPTSRLQLSELLTKQAKLVDGPTTPSSSSIQVTSTTANSSNSGIDSPPLSGVPADPLAAQWQIPSLCDKQIPFGSAIQLSAMGGLRIGLTKRSALSGSQKAVAMAAGVAGVALTGPLSAVLALSALGGGVGKYQLNKTYYLTINKPKPITATALQKQSFNTPNSPDSTDEMTKNNGKKKKLHKTGSNETLQHGEFLLENAEMFSGPRRAVKFGDLVHLYCKGIHKSVRIAQPPNSKRGVLMVTNTDSKAATLRLVSPYGYTGNIVCGSHVYIQVLNGNWTGQYMGLHGDFISSGNSPTIFKVCMEGHACAATNPRGVTDDQHIQTADPALAAASNMPKSSVAAPFKLRVMVYNVWFMPSILSSFNDKLSPSTNQRAHAIPICLAPLDVDVVVFCEAFCGTAKEILVAGMKEQGFLYETKVVGSGASMATKKAIDGGCFVMSKYPIENFQEMTFGNIATGDDRMADKGVIYCQIRVRNDQRVHVFGTHLQAWDSPAAISSRSMQLELVRQFMDSLQLLKEDAVVICGDLNVNKYDTDSQEYRSMLDTLKSKDPELLPRSSLFSFDPLTNELAVDGPSSGGKTERLDYVLLAEPYRQPLNASSEIIPLKATSDWYLPQGNHDEKVVDLSDHYPVVGEFHF